MTVAMLLAVLLLTGVLLFAGHYCVALLPRKGTLDWVALHDQPRLTFQRPRHKMTRKDTLPVLLITAGYALSAFFSLGSAAAPDYRQALDLADGHSYTVEIAGEAVYVSKIWHYGLLGTGSYNLEVSKDAKSWSTLWSRSDQDQWGREKTVYYWAQAQDFSPSYALPQGTNEVFKWIETAPENPQLVRYFRITGRADAEMLQLGKLVFLDENDQVIAYDWSLAGGEEAPSALRCVLAADGTVPGAISWRNSAYFDEIYHPRTALEHIEGVSPYEITHPPLGKLLMGLGIRLFGMTPLGWRFIGTLFGVGMVPLMYVFLKNIFGKRFVAVCGTVLLATEFMHLTQTRIATIDTYGVFFTLLAYLFFYRWLTAPATPGRDGKAREGYAQLALSGVFWGIGCACKWTVLYAGAGLAVLYVIHMILRIRTWDRSETAPRPAPWLAGTLGVSLLSFVAVPVCVYLLSYLPYAWAAGKQDLAGLWQVMWDNQKYMLSYHSGVHSYHPYASRWYQWLVDARPVLYYSQGLGGGVVEKFSSFNNPVLSWAGLLVMVTCLVRCVRRMGGKLALAGAAGLVCCGGCWLAGRVENGPFDPALDPSVLGQRLVVMGLCLLVYLAAAVFAGVHMEGRSSGLDVFITVGFLAQVLPWVFIDRITFAYHYFPATLFLILALCRAFDELADSSRAGWRGPVYGLTAASAGLYLLFYPYLTGLAMPQWYFTNLLQFLPTWP